MITFLAKPIPTADPFQSGVGESGAFFMADSEEDANLIAKSAGARYVVTDIQMAVTGFGGVALTYNASAGLVPYTEPYLLPDQGNRSGTVTFYKRPFPATMLSRLHTFDGSMLRPATVTEIEYAPPRPGPAV